MKRMVAINCTTNVGLRGYPSGKMELLAVNRWIMMGFEFTLLFIKIVSWFVKLEGGGMPGARASPATRVKSGRV